MIRYCKIPAIFLLIFFINGFSNAQKIHLGLLFNDKTDAETNAAYKFLKENHRYIVEKLYLSKITNADSLKKFDALWYHYSDTTEVKEYSEETVKILNQYLTQGGKMLLTLEAFRMINTLGIEPNIPEIRYKKASDNGYGRMLGLHAFKSHPVFDGLNGGAYILKLLRDTVVRQIGYFEDSPVLNGAVVAVDWDYIFVRENSRLMLEYWTGKGRVLALGEYVNLTADNLNRLHLEKFLNNTFLYLKSPGSFPNVNYWQYYQQLVMREDNFGAKPARYFPKPWKAPQSDMLLKRAEATDNFWDVAGERMLVMGKERGGIDEIWSHPFMAFKDYEVSFKLQSSDAITPLEMLTPGIEVRPESFTRIYSGNNFVLKEVIAVSPASPTGVIHYSYDGKEPLNLFIKFKSNLRLMWPYSENVIKTINCGLDEGMNALVIKDNSGNFSAAIGSNAEPRYMEIGPFSDFNIKWIPNELDSNYFEIEPVLSEKFQATGIFQFILLPGEEIDILFSADNRSPENTGKEFRKAAASPETIHINSKNHYDSLLANSLTIQTPDTVFNEGYKWALVATDRFFVNTPGLGKSLVAGYSTTDRGWDGGHKISGRPGYGWYFGRDGEWSGFALLDYGDFEKVKAELEFYQKFQDLNGKIFHEVSTSGFVHYDASDATPLYIVLAGRYLKHSGDIEFIKKSRSEIKKAIDYCYSTDSDGDLLIENTNVGHGWVEGGALFGSHTSLYLASCWAAALDEAAYMAEALNFKAEASKYHTDAETVKKIINSKYWNKKADFYYHGLKKDGSFITDKTIMPAIPMLFKQADNSKAGKILPLFSGDEFSTDWGSRIIMESSKQFNPNGYHTGSVWPLFTGWSALAEYNYGNPVQGYSQIMDNLQVYKDWGLGFVEEVLNGETYKPGGVCPHQCWSETMVLQPAVEGMLGFEPDALNSTVKLSPAFPANWDRAEITNIKAGNHILSLKMKRNGNTISYSFEHTGSSNLKIEFDPQLPDGTTINSMEISGDFESKKLKPDELPEFYISKNATLTYKISGGIKVLPVASNPFPGDKSKGLRIISDKLKNSKYYITIEGIAGQKYEMKLFCREKITGIENGEIISQKDDIFTIRIGFAEGKERYGIKTVVILLNQASKEEK